MKKIFFIISIVIVNFTYAQQGLIQEISISKKDSVRLINIPEIKVSQYYLQTRSPLPFAIDNSANQYWRGIFWQSGCSCGQASSESYVYTYEINRKRNLDASLDENRYAYSFTYNFLNIGNSVCGASWIESEDIIREAGIPNIPTNNSVLSDGNMRHWLTGYDKYYATMQNRINNISAIHVGTPEGLNTLKHWLSDHLEDSPYGGMAFFYANHVYEPDTVPLGTPEAGKHIITAFSNTSHSMSIVGYNDSVRYDYNNDGQYTNDIDITGDGIVDMRDWEIGAFKIANSYNGGSSPIVWADQGFCYVMYRILAYHNSSGGIWDKAAYVQDVKENYLPLLTAKVNLTYDSRDKIKIMAGVSTNLSSSFPEHVEEFPHFRFQGDSLFMQGEAAVSDKTIEFGLDLSELLNYVDSNQAAKYFLYIIEDDPSNEGTGTVNSFSIIDYTSGGTEYTSTQTNVPITDNGNTLLSVESTINYSDVSITTDSIPKAELSSAYNTQLEADGGTEPYRWFPFFDYKISSISNTFTPITGAVVPNSFANINLSFDFPFYGKKYNSGTVSSRGGLFFENEDTNVPYDRDYSVIFRYLKSISPFFGDMSSTTIRYEGDNTYAKLYWNGSFDGNSIEFMITLFPDGTIHIDYGDNTTPNNPEWSAGVTKGDQTSYQEFDFAGQSYPANTRLILEPRPFPEGLDIDKNGVIFGTLTEEFTGDSIFVKIVDNNWLTDVKGFLFTNKGLLLSNYQVNTPDDNILEYGETAQISLDLTNVGEPSINNINLELIDYDTNYVLVDSLDTLTTILMNEVVTLTDAFTFTVAEQIPDNTALNFVIHVESDEVSAADTFMLVARAPVIDIIQTQIIDGNDNILDPGETADLLIYYKNTGGSEGLNLISSYTPTDSYITINTVSNNTIALLEPDSIWIVSINITADAATPPSYYSIIESDIDGDKSFHSDNDISVGIGLIVENWESGTMNEFPWGTSGDAYWYVQNTTFYEGTNALQSGHVNDNGVSVLKIATTVTTAGNISFFRKVSSETNYDFLRFYIDGQQIAEWSGNLDWSNVSYAVSVGLHVFEWKYEKDVTVSGGSDAAWIDFIVFPAIDFSEPLMQVSVSSVEKYMAPNELDTDTIFIYNIGGGIFNYSATIDNATISLLNNNEDTYLEQRNIDGSTLTAEPDSFNTGIPMTMEFAVYNASTDNEWLKDLTVSFPLGVVLDSATSFIGGTNGNMDWDGENGNGTDVNWHGEDVNGWGVVKGGETATATLFLTIDAAIQNSVILQYQIDGDVYGATPHSITDFLVLSNLGENDIWLSLNNEQGNVVATDSASLLLNFNTFGIPEGTYNCIVTIEADVDTVDIPIILHVIDASLVDEIDTHIQVYPNPANNHISIINPTNTEAEIIFYNALGEIQYQEIANSEIININTSNWLDGLYLLRFKQNGKVYNEQIIIN